MEKIAKQVIVFRKDLRNTKGEKLRQGKVGAQCAHASLGALLTMMSGGTSERRLLIKKDSALDAWLNGQFTKICVSVNSEQELIDVYNKAKTAGLPCVLITDAGHTEFEGVATITCCAIGPAWDNEINSITGSLPLL